VCFLDASFEAFTWGEDSSQGLVKCDAVWFCSRVPKFRRFCRLHLQGELTLSFLSYIHKFRVLFSINIDTYKPSHIHCIFLLCRTNLFRIEDMGSVSHLKINNDVSRPYPSKSINESYPTIRYLITYTSKANQ
jgi:hypothetical protein